MIFGFKTKKDKKIQELQAEIDRLKNTLLSVEYKTERCHVIDYHAEVILPFEKGSNVPDDYIKRALANNMLETIKDDLKIEETRDMYRHLTKYRTTLKVVK